MIHDILFKEKESLLFRDSNMAIDLRIKDIFRRFSDGNYADDYFAGILSSPLTNSENIHYRNGILNAFLASDAALDKVTHVLQCIMAHKHKSSQEKRALVYNDPLIDMQNNAKSLKALLILMQELADTAEKIVIDCEPVSKILRRIIHIGRTPANKTMTELCKYIERIKHDDDCIIKLSLNDNCKIDDCEITSLNGKESELQKLFQKITLDNNRDERQWEELPGMGICNTLFDLSNKNAAELLRNIEYSIYDEFSLAAEQIVFYRTACKFIKYMQNHHIELCYPEITPEACFSAENLRDPLLCTVREDVVPYDISLCGGINNMIIVGENNTGKTVLLRSIALAQIMFQGGLPILAKSGKMSIRNGIYTLFATAENLSSSKNMGRFEIEVKKLSEIIKSIPKNSFVFFNEVFQSTDYSDGAKGLYNILKAFERAGIDWTAVTHFNDFIENFNTDARVMCIRMNNDYSFACI